MSDPESESRSFMRSSAFWTTMVVSAIVMVAFFQLFRVETPIELEQLLEDRLTLSGLTVSDSALFRAHLDLADSLFYSGTPPDSSTRSLPVNSVRLFADHIAQYGAELYNSGEYTKAAYFFQLTSRVSNKPQHDWFAIQALCRTGEHARALSLSIRLYEAESAYRPKVYVIAKKIMYDTGLQPDQLPAQPAATL